MKDAVATACEVVREVLEGEGRRAGRRASSLRRSRAALFAQKSALEREVEVARARHAGVVSVLRVPVIVRLVFGRELERIHVLDTRLVALDARLTAVDVRIGEERDFLTSARSLHALVHTSQIPDVVMTKTASIAFVGAAARGRELLRDGKSRPADALALATRLRAMLRTLKVTLEIERRDAPASSPRPVSASVRKLSSELADRRIHLPIPRSMWEVAGRRGALKDGSTGGSSPYYVKGDMDLAKFRDVLPSVFRTDVEPFSFPPIRYGAAGHNLWSMFDRDTWDHVRRSAYASSGHRCGVCGERGGYVAKKLFPDGKRDGVECHEVWDWTPSQTPGLGVQTLRKLLVLCVSCHATFHESYFVGLAAKQGIDDAMRSFVQHRRMVMNRLDPAGLERQLTAERFDLARADGVSSWIVDLGHLQGQQFMSSRIPVFRESNQAGVTPDRVAGLSFETDVGVAYPARDAASVLRSVVQDDARLRAAIGYGGGTMGVSR